MEWRQAWREERAALMRLVALLHALAALAERAAGRSVSVRAMLLWLLRRAESIARDYVCGGEDLPLAPCLWPAALAPAGNRPEDALHLAETFRMLAWLLEAQIGLLAAPSDGRAGPTGNRPVRLSAATKTLAAFAVLGCDALTHRQRVPTADTS